ncbi:putative transferase [Helianthus annuus]|uniref:Putative polyprenyl synthetase n=1 Tax=Helianthus annuus TaxID=4232 RepID=A0A251T9K2_HELAN|nr:putative transferase [Helianthus annuus]KAJ0500930.1 putative transferase [Helianthus annuus]KAJ0508582.1 putative transferase [Helianthus annuus]KAJ0516822.1 putative transferase [Helianthus annuus]KAJ0684827.1 putative transferase [Helianthus annuus]
MPYISSCSKWRILQYKSSYYSFYLPVACALLLLGENPDDYVQMKDILVEMGIYYQIQIGTDIEERKCSWLVAKALELASEEQKQILYENYGKKDQACVEKVKELYHTLNLQGVYEEYEKMTHEEFMKLIESHPSNVYKQC